MAEAAKRPPSSKTRRIIRGLLVLALILVAAVAIRWAMLVSDYKAAVALYEEGKYQDAQARLETVLRSPLAAIRIRPMARQTLGLCKAEIAAEIAEKERTAAGYAQAIELLSEAAQLAGRTEEIDRRIKEYTEYKEKLERPAPAPVAK